MTCSLPKMDLYSEKFFIMQDHLALMMELLGMMPRKVSMVSILTCHSSYAKVDSVPNFGIHIMFLRLRWVVGIHVTSSIGMEI